MCKATQRIRELMDAGAEIRVFKPDGGGYASMHIKTWLFDNTVVVTGSPNTTENGLTRNEEQLWKFQVPSCARFVQEHFNKRWEEAQPVTSEDVNRAEERSQERKSRSRSASQARQSRSPSRSQSTTRRLPMELVGSDGE